MVKIISMNHLPQEVKTLFCQLYLNALLIYIPDGICTNTVYSVLGHLKFQLRSMYLFDGERAMLDVVPKDFTTIPLIKQKAPIQYNLMGEKIYIGITPISGSVKYPFVVDYAYALLYGMCPGGWMDVDYLCYNPKWRPYMSDHRFCIQRAGSRSL